jgi:hypothetical protein
MDFEIPVALHAAVNPVAAINPRLVQLLIGILLFL